MASAIALVGDATTPVLSSETAALRVGSEVVFFVFLAAVFLGLLAARDVDVFFAETVFTFLAAVFFLLDFFAVDLVVDFFAVDFFAVVVLLVVFFLVVLRVFEGVATLLPDAVLPDRERDPEREAPDERALFEGEALVEPALRLAVPALVRLEVVLALLARLVVNAGVRSALEG